MEDMGKAYSSQGTAAPPAPPPNDASTCREYTFRRLQVGTRPG